MRYLGTQDVEDRHPTGRPDGLRRRNGAITISMLFTAAMPPMSSMRSILEGAFARLTQHAHLFNGDVLTFAPWEKSQRSFRPRVRFCIILWCTKSSNCSCSSHKVAPVSTKKTKSMHRTLHQETHEFFLLVSVVHEIVTHIIQNQYLLGALTTSAPPVWDTCSDSVSEQQSKMA